jgi:hypothetical protein
LLEARKKKKEKNFKKVAKEELFFYLYFSKNLHKICYFSFLEKKKNFLAIALLFTSSFFTKKRKDKAAPLLFLQKKYQLQKLQKLG